MVRKCDDGIWKRLIFFPLTTTHYGSRISKYFFVELIIKILKRKKNQPLFVIRRNKIYSYDNNTIDSIQKTSVQYTRNEREFFVRWWTYVYLYAKLKICMQRKKKKQISPVILIDRCILMFLPFSFRLKRRLLPKYPNLYKK